MSFLILPSITGSTLLGKALLWRIMDPIHSQSCFVPSLYLAIEGNILAVEENPITKIPLLVHGYGEDLC